MNSRLYECRVMHARFSPQRHRFAYRLFYCALDLDELPALTRRLHLLAFNRPGLLAWREADFLPTGDLLHNPSASFTPPAAAAGAPPAVRPPPARPAPAASTPPATKPDADATPPGAALKARVLAYLAAHGIEPGAGARVLLVTLPQVAGYAFNPVSFYFCQTPDGRPVAALAEVTNTFREMKTYLLGPECFTPAASAAGLASGADGVAPASAGAATGFFARRVPKHFYVSPFSDVDAAFAFHLPVPGERLAIRIDDYVDGQRTLTSTLAGTPRPLTDAALAWFTLKYPFLTLRVILLIHWHALRLYLKRVPWFAKSARAADQRDLYHPHPSLTSAQPLTPEA